jgi:hypothetical protein
MINAAVGSRKTKSEKRSSEVAKKNKIKKTPINPVGVTLF